MNFLQELRIIIDSMETDNTKLYVKGRKAAGLKLRNSMKQLKYKIQEYRDSTLELEKVLAIKAANKLKTKKNSGNSVPEDIQ